MARVHETTIGSAELRATRAESRHLLWAVGIFSLFVNLLMLTGPLYMLQVYDRVLGSQSEATLAALTLLMAFLFLIMGLLDFVRGRLLARIGARFQSRLDKRVFSAMLRRSAAAREPDADRNHLRDLESVQRLLSAPVLTAFFDMPWTPIFLFVIFIFHPWLGILAVSGAALLVALALANQLLTERLTKTSAGATVQSERLSEQIRHEAEMVRSLGMQEAMFARWQKMRDRALDATIHGSDVGGSFTSVSRTLRLFLQSAMLGLGALLVLRGEMTAGAMIASSIMLGRALAPVDLALGQWSLLQRARQGWNNLAELLGQVPSEPPRVALPRPSAHLAAEQVTVIPPGQTQAALRLVSFQLKPGEALGVIGPSGSGKSTLARAIVGVWRAAGGRIRLGGAALEQYEPDVLGQHIGYLPQRVQLFDGTIAENIARMQIEPDAEAVVAAAQKAAAHDMIVELSDGYNTSISSATGRLSGGQMQRIGLARAVYGNPVLLVLDEPNSNLDKEGTDALNTAIDEIKAAGGSVVIMAHRPSAIAKCESLLVLEQGTTRAFGPRDQVLRQVVQNPSGLSEGTSPKGALR